MQAPVNKRLVPLQKTTVVMSSRLGLSTAKNNKLCKLPLQYPPSFLTVVETAPDLLYITVTFFVHYGSSKRDGGLRQLWLHLYSKISCAERKKELSCVQIFGSTPSTKWHTAKRNLNPFFSSFSWSYIEPTRAKFAAFQSFMYMA